MEIPSQYQKGLYRAILALIIIITVHFAVGLLADLKSANVAGNKDIYTIILSGHGEVNAVPDIANISFTISKDAKTVKEAQNSVAQIEKKVLELLKTDKVADKDIKTANASFYPKYEYSQAFCPPIPLGAGTAGVTSSLRSPYYCPPSKQVITGYTASESVTVKIRNTDDVGKIMQDLGTAGVSQLNGPDFAIDDEDGLKMAARKKAIDQAKAKAEALAKDLGVHLGHITNFSESGNYGGPIYYAKGMAADSTVATVPALIPKGENIISSDVTITYEIR